MTGLPTLSPGLAGRERERQVPFEHPRQPDESWWSWTRFAGLSDGGSGAVFFRAPVPSGWTRRCCPAKTASSLIRINWASVAMCSKTSGEHPVLGPTRTGSYLGVDRVPVPKDASAPWVVTCTPARRRTGSRLSTAANWASLAHCHAVAGGSSMRAYCVSVSSIQQRSITNRPIVLAGPSPEPPDRRGWRSSRGEDGPRGARQAAGRAPSR